MASKQENRATLKALQKIVNGRGDADVPQVFDELRAVIGEAPPAAEVEPEPEETEEREEKTGRDRMARWGHTRER